MLIFPPGCQGRRVSLPCGYFFPLCVPGSHAIRSRWAGTATVMTGRARQLQNLRPVRGIARCECNQSVRPAFKDRGKCAVVLEVAACLPQVDSLSPQDTPESSSRAVRCAFAGTLRDGGCHDKASPRQASGERARSRQGSRGWYQVVREQTRTSHYLGAWVLARTARRAWRVDLPPPHFHLTDPCHGAVTRLP